MLLLFLEIVGVSIQLLLDDLERAAGGDADEDLLARRGGKFQKCPCITAGFRT